VSACGGPPTLKSVQDYSKTCSKGAGFAGSTGYTGAKGALHQAAAFSNTVGDWFPEQPSDFPKGWVAGFNGDPSTVQLVVCYERQAPTTVAKTCQMEDDSSKQQYSLSLFNTRYRLRVLAARTGEVLYEHVAETKTGDCPLIQVTSGDRTKTYNDLRPKDYTKLIKPYLAP
jgi:hypothetical protein